MGKLLQALNECSEWGQVLVLDAVASYSPTTARAAETILEKVFVDSLISLWSFIRGRKKCEMQT